MTGKSKAEAGLLRAVRDMKAGRAARVSVPDGKGGMVLSVSRACAHGIRPHAAKIRIAPRCLSSHPSGMGAGAQESVGRSANPPENRRYKSESVARSG